MFRRNFRSNFDFSEESYLSNNEDDLKKYDRSIYVVYDKTELLEFFKLNKKGKNVLVCLFNKDLRGLSFLNEMSNLVVLDNTKTRSEIIDELKLHLVDDFNSGSGKIEIGNKAPIFQSHFQNLYKAMFFLM